VSRREALLGSDPGSTARISAQRSITVPSSRPRPSIPLVSMRLSTARLARHKLSLGHPDVPAP
jgi:hypothetical protein